MLLAACASPAPVARVATTIAVGRAPHGLAFAEDGRDVYLAEAGAGSVAVVDLRRGWVRERWPAGDTPLDLVSDGAGGFWVTQFRSDHLLHLDGRGQVLGTLPVAEGPSLFSTRQPGGKRGLVAERGDTFLLFDPAAGQVVQEFATGARPYPAAITRDGVLAFVPNAEDGTLSVLDLLNWEQAATVAVGGRPRGGALTADDVSYVVATSEPDALVFVNTASFEVEARVTRDIGPAPFSVCIPGDGRLALVNDAGGDTLSLVDLAERRVVQKLAVGEQPIVVRAHPDGRRALVACEAADRLCVVELPPPAPAPPFVAPNEVLVLGMIHDGHETSPRYDLALVEALVRAFEPDVVCVEIPPNRMQAAWKGFRETGLLVEPRARRFPEYTDVLFPLTRELDLELVPTAGWTEPMARYRSHALRRIEADPARAAEWREYTEAQAAATAAIEAGGGADDPDWIHTDAYDAAAELELSVYQRLFGDELGPGGWDAINAAHWANVERLLDERTGQGLRILITYGAWHKGWFLRRLREREDLRLLEVRPFLEAARAALGRGRRSPAGERGVAGA